GPLLFTQEDFLLKYYSFKTILFGLYESSLSFNLIVPLVISGLFLIKRQVIDFKVSGVFLLIYSLLAISYHQGAGFELWILPLQFINGSLVFCAVFLIGDVVTLPTRTIFKYAYVTATAILTFIMTYYVHFVLGPYLALFISQAIVFVIRLVNISVLPSIKLQLTK
ncbi:MAG: RnfABCDGE type electron transport complex subunit D, partial [Turicibacter sp.]